MYPGPDDPDLGVFVQQLEEELRRRGHELERAVLDRRAGGKRRYAELVRRTASAARRFRPDVVYAHFLVPTGLVAALSSRAPLVVTAHGRDVRNIGAFPGIRPATRFVVRRAAAVVAVSDYLRARARDEGAGGPRKSGGRGLRRRSRALSRRARARGPDRVPLRRLADRAQERRPPGRSLRAVGRGNADVRGRRPAARATSKAGPESPSSGRCRTRRCRPGSPGHMSSASPA